MNKVVAIIQARMGSTRLPGKVLLPLVDKSVLGHVITRVAHAKGIDEIVIATSLLAQDNVIEEEAHRYGALCYRGSEKDVLSRYYEAAKLRNADVIIRITADCPFVDPWLLTDMLQEFKHANLNGNKIDYLSNSLKRTFPRGLDIEIFSQQALEKAFLASSESFQREHVTPYIYQHPDLFVLYDYVNPTSSADFRLTLDTKEDLELITVIYKSLYKAGECFTTTDIMLLFEKHPELSAINEWVTQKSLYS